jgi:hypothetical protein
MATVFSPRTISKRRAQRQVAQMVGHPNAGALKHPQARNLEPKTTKPGRGARCARLGDHGQPSKEKNPRIIMVAPLFVAKRLCFSSRRGFPGVDKHGAQDKGLRCPGRDGGRDHEPPEGEKPRKKASTERRAFLRGFSRRWRWGRGCRHARALRPVKGAF